VPGKHLVDCCLSFQTVFLWYKTGRLDLGSIAMDYTNYRAIEWVQNCGKPFSLLLFFFFFFSFCNILDRSRRDFFSVVISYLTLWRCFRVVLGDWKLYSEVFPSLTLKYSPLTSAPPNHIILSTPVHQPATRPRKSTTTTTKDCELTYLTSTSRSTTSRRAKPTSHPQRWPPENQH
jgi:hypothetical protein